MISDSHKAAFRRIALNHISSRMSDDEWQILRYEACCEDRWVDGGERTTVNATRKELVKAATMVIAVELPQTWRSEPVGVIDGRPMVYFPQHGIFVWPSGTEKLMLWLSHPAYPPGW